MGNNFYDPLNGHVKHVNMTSELFPDLWPMLRQTIFKQFATYIPPKTGGFLNFQGV